MSKKRGSKARAPEKPLAEPAEQQALAPPPKRRPWFLVASAIVLVAWMAILFSLAIVSWRTWK